VLRSAKSREIVLELEPKEAEAFMLLLQLVRGEVVSAHDHAN
jgi:hypothetical protein